MGLNRNLGNITEAITELSGSIGIGVTPTNKLQVTDNLGSTTDPTVYRPIANFYSGGNSSAFGLTIGSRPLTANTSQGGYIQSNSSLLHRAGYDHIFQSGGSFAESMRILSGGNVGINDSNPSSKLTVVGPSLGNIIKWTDNINNTGFLGIRNLGVSIGSDDDLIFETGGTSKMRLYKSGNLYIGTSPVDSVKLKVEDSGANSIMSLGTTTTTGRTTIDLLTNGYDWEIGARGSANSPNNSFYIYNIDTSSYRLVISPTGYVGLGTQSPNAKLHVVGNTVTAGAAYVGQYTNGTAYIDAFGGAAYFGNGDYQHALWIYNNGTYAFTGGPASDRRAKENINDLTFNATEKVMALQPKSYYMKSNSKQIKYGFIAQDVHELLPDLICGDLEGEDYVGLDYNGIIPVLTKAIQEQQEIIKQLTNRIINLENK